MKRLRTRMLVAWARLARQWDRSPAHVSRETIKRAVREQHRRRIELARPVPRVVSVAEYRRDHYWRFA